jgi:hypothetical protein
MQKLELIMKNSIYIFSFKLILKTKRRKKKPEIKWVVGHPQSISGVASKLDNHPQMPWSPEASRGGTTTHDLFCGWPSHSLYFFFFLKKKIVLSLKLIYMSILKKYILFLKD